MKLKSKPKSPHPTVWTLALRDRRATVRFGKALGRTLPSGSTLALAGELGAGKTTLVQALALGLEVPDLRQVVSPTFTLVNEYLGGRLPLVHVDFYRLQDAAAAEALGLEETLNRRDAIVAIEWADHIPEMIPQSAIWLRFEWKGRGGRKVNVTGMAKPVGIR